MAENKMNQETTNQATGKEKNNMTLEEQVQQALKEQETQKIQVERLRISKNVEELLQTELDNIRAGKKYKTIAHKIWVNGVSNTVDKQRIEIEILDELVKNYRKRGYLVDKGINLTGVWIFIDPLM